MPVASATDGGHRDCPVLASVAQWPEIQPLVSRGQIVSAVLLLLTDRQTDTQTDNYMYNFSIMMHTTVTCMCTVYVYKRFRSYTSDDSHTHPPSIMLTALHCVQIFKLIGA